MSTAGFGKKMEVHKDSQYFREKINGSAIDTSISVCFGCVVVEASEDCFYIVFHLGLSLVYRVSALCTYVAF